MYGRWGCSHVVTNPSDVPPLNKIQERKNVLCIIKQHVLLLVIRILVFQTQAQTAIFLSLFFPFCVSNAKNSSSKSSIKLYFQQTFQTRPLAHLTQSLQVHSWACVLSCTQEVFEPLLKQAYMYNKNILFSQEVRN